MKDPRLSAGPVWGIISRGREAVRRGGGVRPAGRVIVAIGACATVCLARPSVGNTAPVGTPSRAPGTYGKPRAPGHSSRFERVAGRRALLHPRRPAIAGAAAVSAPLLAALVLALVGQRLGVEPPGLGLMSPVPPLHASTAGHVATPAAAGPGGGSGGGGPGASSGAVSRTTSVQPGHSPAPPSSTSHASPPARPRRARPRVTEPPALPAPAPAPHERSRPGRPPQPRPAPEGRGERGPQAAPEPPAAPSQPHEEAQHPQHHEAEPPPREGGAPHEHGAGGEPQPPPPVPSESESRETPPAS
jgi:hypothetical protein